MKILMLLTSHDRLGDTGEKTGFWLEEFAAPYYEFKDAGAEIVLASPHGGQPPLDPKSDAPDAQTAATDRFRADPEAVKALATTHKLSDVVCEAFDAVFYPGGHGPLWDLAENLDSIGLIEILTRLNRGEDQAGSPIGHRASFTIACALDPTAHDAATEWDRLERKLAAGAHLVMEPLAEAGDEAPVHFDWTEVAPQRRSERFAQDVLAPARELRAAVVQSGQALGRLVRGLIGWGGARLASGG